MQLRDAGLGLDGKRQRTIIGDMEQTLLPRRSRPGSLEEAVDSLVEMGIDPGWWGYGHFVSVQWVMQGDAGCRKLRDAGLEAVPTLIEHIGDFRVTRCIDNSRGEAFHARIADVVAQLLDGLANEEFSYDVLSREGRGKRLDKAHVLHWWATVRGTDALEYLRSHAVVKNAGGGYTANAALLHALGQRYPNELAALFKEHVNHAGSEPLFEALGDSKASDESKARLFRPAARSADLSKRTCAICELLKLKDPEGASLLIQELDAIARTPTISHAPAPRGSDWWSGPGQIAQLIHYTTDERVWAALQAPPSAEMYGNGSKSSRSSVVTAV